MTEADRDGRPPGGADPWEPTEAEIDAALAEFGGDARATIRALLHDLNELAADHAGDIALGHVLAGSPWARRTG